MDQRITEAAKEMVERSWQADPVPQKQTILELDTLADLRRFIKTMPEDTIASIEIRVVLKNG